MPAIPATDLPTRGVRFGIFAISLAILLLQIALTRLLSVVLWYHFAFVAISLAMLGLALSGIALYLAPRLMRATPALLPWYCRGAAVAMVLALAYVTFLTPTATGTDLFAGRIVVLYLVLLVPFTLAGFAVSATLTYHARHIGPLYARDLAGAAVGCMLAVPLLDLTGAPTTTLIGAGLLALGGLTYAAGRSRAVDVLLLAALLGIGSLQVTNDLFEPVAMHGIPDDNRETGVLKDFAGWNSHSRIVVTPTSDWAKMINIDGHATTGVYRFDRQVDQVAVREQLNWMPIRSGSMPYVVLEHTLEGKRPDVLLIGPGGGLDLLNGIYYGARILGVELNGLIHRLMTTGPIADWSGHVYDAPDVEVVHDEARSWIRRSDRRFDLIQASMIDTWAATANGAFALAENALYTVEAFVDYREHLTEHGIVHFMRWNEQPPRQSLRVLVLVDAAMQQAGEYDLDRHVVVIEEPQPVEGPTMASLLWSNAPFAESTLAHLKSAIVARQKIGPVRILCWPGESLDNALSRFVRSEDRQAFLRDYAFDVTPTTDDRPFFFHTARLGDTIAHNEAGAENEQAVAVLRSVLFTVLVITLLAFAVPLLWTFRQQRLGRPLPALVKLLYFAAIGIGFMLVEIPMLQRFGLYMGHPTWSLSVVLGSLLLGAGAGGMSTGRVHQDAIGKTLAVAISVIVALLLVLNFVLPSLLAATLKWSFLARASLTAAVLIPVGAALGMALPLGVRSLHRSAQALVPWAWGVNGVTSVLASVLAIAIGMEAGFAVALGTGIACYALAGLLSRRLV